MHGRWRHHRRRGRWHEHHHPSHVHGRRLFWRVYLHGLFLLVAVVAAMAVVGWALGRGRDVWAQALQIKQQVESGGRALLADSAELHRILARASERANADVTIYDASGKLLATNVEPPLPPVESEFARRLPDVSAGPPPRWRGSFVFPLRERGELIAYAVAQWRGPGPRQILRFASFVGGVLLVLALASVPLVRTIVAPLEQLTRAARALGEGDLSTRSGIRRRDEVGELARAFDEMAERLERLVRNERELLANVSHELRTPLSRIRVALELGEEGDAERARKYLKEIGSDLAELEQLLEDVLTAARLDTSKAGNGFPLHVSAVHAGEFVDSAARRFREAWPSRPLVEEITAPLPVIDADPVLLRRVLDNLLDNARKYSEDGKPIRLRAAAVDGVLRVEVADEGIGMSESDLRQLFTPFFRTDRSRARGTGGVGLGLTLARRIVDAHGGSLTAASEPGRGSTFTVKLPLRRPIT
ncbi:MAG TPA: HAMP domain-containing sensor histidine kinase [Myxococcaceae bacterium]|nr:HAMP domain-containing sensor histidine kinase [Myxococcaceae bacterium]